ncbi:hypothetical protein SRO_0345 [Streptomyces rochei]|nr:hypothetical protein SRO_0345 [Streptomyces rochei]
MPTAHAQRPVQLPLPIRTFGPCASSGPAWAGHGVPDAQGRPTPSWACGSAGDDAAGTSALVFTLTIRQGGIGAVVGVGVESMARVAYGCRVAVRLTAVEPTRTALGDMGPVHGTGACDRADPSPRPACPTADGRWS